MTYKDQLEAAKAAKDAQAAAAEAEHNEKKVELEAIADKLEAHLTECKPAEVGLKLERDGAHMKLVADSGRVIIIDAGFLEYTGMIQQGPQPVLGSRQRLATLEDVDAYIVEILVGS